MYSFQIDLLIDKKSVYRLFRNEYRDESNLETLLDIKKTRLVAKTADDKSVINDYTFSYRIPCYLMKKFRETEDEYKSLKDDHKSKKDEYKREISMVRDSNQNNREKYEEEINKYRETLKNLLLLIVFDSLFISLALQGLFVCTNLVNLRKTKYGAYLVS